MNPRYSRYFTFIRPVIKNRQVKTYSTLAFSLIAIIIFTIFAIKPTIGTILSLQKSIDEQEKILEQLNTKAQNLSQGKENLKKIDSNTLAKLNNLMPSKTDPAFLADSLVATALANNASISGLQFQPVELVGTPSKLNKDAQLKELVFTFNVSSSYSNLVNILTALKTNARLISIDSVNFNQVSDGPLVMSVNGKAYFLQN
jgi:Tfp pilus assembly protein PilO